MIASDIQFPKFSSEIYGRIALNEVVGCADSFAAKMFRLLL